MKSLVQKLHAQNIYPYGSEQALRQEAHVARFLAREYQSALDSSMTLEEIGISTISGPMWEETESLMETHYDERIEVFDSFLDHDYYAYSMALYGSESKYVREAKISLERAQEDKFHLICDRIGIQGKERILNIGCGFGSLERYLCRHYPSIQITGINPSVVQTKYIQHCVESDDCFLNTNNFRVISKRFDDLNANDFSLGSFDIVCSIGLLEHVKNMDALNAKISRYLKPGGKAFHHFIVSKMIIPQFLEAKKTMIGKYFPGGRIWPLHELGMHTRDLDLVNIWFINGLNYWRTLDEWHSRFWHNIEMLADMLTAKQIRYWNDYFILCKACFLPMEGTLFGNGQYLFRKPL